MKRAISIVVLALLGGGSAAFADDAPAPPTVRRALVAHVAPITSEAGVPIELEAAIDAPLSEQVVARWRAIGEATWHDAPFERSSAGTWFVALPAATTPGVEYYIRGIAADGAEVVHFASADAPHAVLVEPSTADRLEALDRARLGGLDNELALDVYGQDFGNRYGLADQFVRGELTYVHHLLRVLDEIGFGFGSISGQTPMASAPDADVLTHGLRYGFGQIRLRLHPSIFVDARLGLGVSDQGFEQNIRGAITFGKPWRSSVQIGAEYFGDLGANAWVRLQWDTVPPVLMGLAIVRTDLPGAVLDRGGLYVAYDAAYRLTPRLSVKGQLSYGARDGAAHFGGGVATAVSF